MSKPGFVGLGATQGAGGEPAVRVIVPKTITITSMFCYEQAAATSTGGNIFTLVVNGTASSLSCNIANGATTGSGTGSVSVTAGQQVDVATPGNLAPLTPGSFGLGF
jgi:hypothetical protein